MPTSSALLPPVPRRRTRTVKAGGIVIGGGAPISVQSMTKTDTRDAGATLAEVVALAAAGAELVRLAVPDMEAARALAEIRRHAPVPLVADIHFDHRLALVALEAGIDKLRINPGNIGGPDRVRLLARECRARGVPIRIGVNGGSLEKRLLAKYGGPTPQAMVESGLEQAGLLEDEGFSDIVISLKASDVPTTVAAYRAAAATTDYPLHLGITEAGGRVTGTVRSSVGIGMLLAEGIGDTLRVSLTAPGIEEVAVGYEILSSLGLRRHGVHIVSCPTCGRTHGDLFGLAAEVERLLAGEDLPVSVAIMGCEVNGPGEARMADVGLALGEGTVMLFRRGEPVERVPQAEAPQRLVALARQVAEARGTGTP